MTFDSIWQQLCRKNPKLENEEAGVVFKSVHLKALLRQVYEQGERNKPEPDQPKNPFPDIFSGLGNEFRK